MADGIQRCDLGLASLVGLGLALVGCVLPNPAFDGASVSGDATASGTTSAPATASGASTSSGLTTGSGTTTTGAEVTTEASAATIGTSTGTSTDTSTDTSTGTATATSTGGGDGPSCSGQGPQLVACYHFPVFAEDILLDGSSYEHHGIFEGAELVDSPLGVGAYNTRQSDIRLFDTSDAVEPLDFAGEQASILVALRLDSYAPAGMRSAVLDKGGQYSIYIWDNGDVRCQFGDFTDNASFEVPLGEWTHIGCVFGETAVRVYVNGEEVAFFEHTTSANLGPNNDLVLGADSPDLDARMDGVLDNVELWSQALSAEQLCERAGPLCTL